MKTHNATRMAMGLIYLMALILFGCTQYGAAGNMDTSSEGPMTEKTDKNMGSTMDTMKGDTMQNTMDQSKDTMMKDTSKDMMK